jgi:hypothetical protein
MHAIPLLHSVPSPAVPDDWFRPSDLAAVQSPDDLPSWFAVGAFDAEAFSSDARNWCARWADDAALSSLLVEYHRPTRRARVRTQFLGSNPLEATAVASLQEQLLTAAFDPMSSGFDATLARALVPLAVAVPPRYGRTALWAPFGPMMVLAVPLHALRVDAWCDWMTARGLSSPRDRVQAWVGLSGSSVRYDETHRPSWFTGVEAARAAISAATGLPAGVEPSPLRDGRPGWFVDRPVYLAMMLVPMAGIPSLASDLHAAGFIATSAEASWASLDGAKGLEMEAFVLTTEALERAGTFTCNFESRGIAEITYALTPCSVRVPWPEWLKYAAQGGVASLPAPAPMPPVRSTSRH